MSDTLGGAVPLRSSRQLPENDQLRGRAARYLAKHGPAIAGQGGDDHTYRAACILTRDFALPDHVALDVLQEWNEACRPPWSNRELAAFIEHATKYARGERGSKLRGSKKDPEQLFDDLLSAMDEGLPAYVQRYFLEELSEALPWWRARCGQNPSPRSIPKAYRSLALSAAIGLYLLLHQKPPRRTRLEWLMGQAAYEYDGPGHGAEPLWIWSSPEQARRDALDHGRRLGASQGERMASEPWAQAPRTPEDEVMRAQELAIIGRLRTDLSDLERVVVDNLPDTNTPGALARSNEALAAEYGTTPATIKQARHRIREKARKFTEPAPGRSPVPWSTAEIPEVVGDGAARVTKLRRRAPRRPAQDRRAA